MKKKKKVSFFARLRHDNRLNPSVYTLKKKMNLLLKLDVVKISFYTVLSFGKVLSSAGN